MKNNKNKWMCDDVCCESDRSDNDNENRKIKRDNPVPERNTGTHKRKLKS